MNFNAANVTMFGIGVILLYAAITDKSPKDVVTGAMTTSSKAPAKPAASRTKSAPTGKVRRTPNSPADPVTPGDSFHDNSGSSFQTVTSV